MLFRLGHIVAMTEFSRSVSTSALTWLGWALGRGCVLSRQCLWMVCRQAVRSLSARTNKGAEGVLLMPTAIELIVGTYVLLKNWQALEEMLLHRQRLAVDLNGRSGFDANRSIHQVDEDIAVIKAGLAVLGGAAVVPPVDWP